MPNTWNFLSNDQHLLPLLKWYLQHVDQNLESVAKLDDSHYEYIKNPDGTVSGFRPDVICEGQAGGQNITEGYWRAFAQSLARDQEMPEKIRVVSFINHSNMHWTCSVAELSLDPDFYKKMQDALRQRYSEIEIAQLRTIDLQNFINAQFKGEGSDIDIIHDQKIIGSTEAVIRHYDSLNPGSSMGGYYLEYQDTLNVLFVENGQKVRLESKSCKRQAGNTCGDCSLYNGYADGILGLNLGIVENQIDSVALRAFTEHHVPSLKAKLEDKLQVDSVIEFIPKLMRKIKQDEMLEGLDLEKPVGLDNLIALLNLQESTLPDSSSSSLSTGKFKSVDMPSSFIKIETEISKPKPIITTVYSSVPQPIAQSSGLSPEIAEIVSKYTSKTHKDFVYGLKPEVLSVFNSLSLDSVADFGDMRKNKVSDIIKLKKLSVEELVVKFESMKTAYKPGL